MLYRNAKMFWKNIKNTILEKKSLKGPFAIYLDLEYLLKNEPNLGNNNNNDNNI